MTVTNILVAINVIAYIWETSTGALSSDDSLLSHGALYGPSVVVDHEYWRIVTGAFLHASLTHIGFNMIALYQVGTAVERLIGGPRMLLIYTISMIGSGITVVLFSYNQPTVGASGAIFGLFGALVGIGLRLGAPGRGLIMQVLPIIVINLVITFAVPNISASGHIGGLISGFLVGLAAFEMRPRPQVLAQAAAGEPLAGEANAGEPFPDAIGHGPDEQSSLEEEELAHERAAGYQYERPPDEPAPRP